jgi:hypothetical protein
LIVTYQELFPNILFSSSSCPNRRIMAVNSAPSKHTAMVDASFREGDTITYDRSATSRLLCLYGLGIGSLGGLISLSFGIYLVHSPGRNQFLSWDKTISEFMPLLINVLVTIHNETAGYILTVSLRWALQREGRLGFSSNLRLFSLARSSPANSWYANLGVAVCIILTYASASLIFISDYDQEIWAGGAYETLMPAGKTVYVNGYALITLGMGMLGQGAVAAACLRGMRHVPTWSSNLMEVASACLATGAIQRQPGRCMRSVHQIKLDSEPAHPMARQQSVFRAQKQARIVFYVLWASVLLAIIWATALLLVIRHSNVVQGVVNGYSLSFFPVSPNPSIVGSGTGRDTLTGNWTPSVAIPWLIVGSRGSNGLVSPEWKEHIYFPSYIGILAVVCVLQAFITLSLHCAEILVNMTRDELMWRRAGSKGLARPGFNAMFSAMASLPGVTLFALKPVLHWFYGLAVSPYLTTGVFMRVPQIYYLSVGVAALTTFVSVCVFWRPSGPQPATFGHLQTLVDLVDEWPGEDERMYWGRKSSGDDAFVVSGFQRSIPDAMAPTTYGETIPFQMAWDGDVELSTFKKPQRIYEKFVARKPKYTSIPSATELQLDGSVPIAHAGTSTTPLEKVRLEELYAGRYGSIVGRLGLVARTTTRNHR